MAHYDVNKVVAAFKASHAASKLPENVPNFARIQHRNSAVTVEFLRMVLTEMNRGSSHDDVLLAASNIMVDFIVNFAGPFAPSKKKLVFDAFTSRIHGLLSDIADGTEEVIISASTEFEAEKGGHA